MFNYNYTIFNFLLDINFHNLSFNIVLQVFMLRKIIKSHNFLSKII